MPVVTRQLDDDHGRAGARVEPMEHCRAIDCSEPWALVAVLEAQVHGSPSRPVAHPHLAVPRTASNTGHEDGCVIAGLVHWRS